MFFDDKSQDGAAKDGASKSSVPGSSSGASSSAEAPSSKSVGTMAKDIFQVGDRHKSKDFGPPRWKTLILKYSYMQL